MMLLQHLAVLAVVQITLSQVLKEERIEVQLEEAVNVNDTSRWRWRSNAGKVKTAHAHYPDGCITVPEDPAVGVTVRFRGVRYSHDKKPIVS